MFLCFIFWDLLMLMLMYYYYCGVFEQSYLGNRALPNAAQQHTEPNRIVHHICLVLIFYFIFWNMARKPNAMCIYLGTHICMAWHAAMTDKPYTRSLGCSFFASSFRLFACFHFIISICACRFFFSLPFRRGFINSRSLPHLRWHRKRYVFVGCLVCRVSASMKF